MLPYDVRQFSDEAREQLAWRVHESADVPLPHLEMWNYALCKKHRRGWVRVDFDPEGNETGRTTITDTPFPGCRECGIHFRKHQRVGIMWLYLRKRGLLADPMGSGKTSHAGGLIAMLHQTGEIESVGKVIVVPRAPALGQWNQELLRMMPNLNLVVASGSAAQRRDQYLMGWDVLLISPQTLLNDYVALERFPLSALITDDVDSLRNHKNKTAHVLKHLGRQADRMVVMTGTPFQKRLIEAHSTLEALGGDVVFGDATVFERTYMTTRTIREIDPSTNHMVVRTVPGYRHLDDFKRRMAPMVLRRSIADMNDVSMPEINPNDVFLELYPRQRAKYNELKSGVLKILHEEQGLKVKHVGAMAKIMYGAQICGGLATLGEEDTPESSIKMDWIMDKLTGELEDEKVVIFSNFKNSVRALQDRFRQAGIGFETVWGLQPSKEARNASQERFWRDPSCRVLIGTQAIEQSLNLQVARHLINMDMILNPARMAQLAGRIRRDGSAFKHVFVHNLLAVGTQEERYLPLLEREAALSSHIWDENSELFNALSPTLLLTLITGT